MRQAEARYNDHVNGFATGTLKYKVRRYRCVNTISTAVHCCNKSDYFILVFFFEFNIESVKINHTSMNLSCQNMATHKLPEWKVTA